VRSFAIGVVHGPAGSAAVALLVLGVIRDAFWALGYLLIFGAGTIVGMLVVTTLFALPVALMAQRSGRLHRSLCLVTGVGSLLFGAFLSYQIGFERGLFSDHVEWTPE
jgi:high-affinity nickel-transport protein